MAVAPAASASPPAATRVEAVVAARSRENGRLAPKTEVRVVGVTSAGERTSRTWATLAHPPDAVVRGDVLVSGNALRGVAVVADEDGARGDYGAALHWVTDRGARRMCGGVLHASRPLVDEDGVVFVERGVPGPLVPRALREDNLQIDAVAPDTGAIRVVATWNGYAMHLAGAFERELVVYRVGPRGAELVAIDRASGRTRSLRTIAPFARDFSVDAARGLLVYANRDERDPRVWAVERIDLRSGALARLGESRGEAQTPFAHASGRVLASALARRGLGEAGAAQAPVVAPFGEGYSYVTDAAAATGWIAIAHVPNERGPDRVGLYAEKTRQLVELSSTRERVDVLGIVAGARGDTLR